MRDLSLFDLFPPEYSDLILRYKNTLPQIFSRYDAVIFMARKSICFYKSLVIGKFIEKPQNCEVFSSRILSYNIYEIFNGKRVIIIDDVMIKGHSINDAVKNLSNNGIMVDVYVMSRQQLNVGEADNLRGVNIVETFAELTEEDTLQLSKHIADFIEASMCPYNIDQPIYNLSHFDEDKIFEFVETYSLINTSSRLKRKYGITSYVIELPKTCFINPIFEDKVEMCKIRFFHGLYGSKIAFLAVPFVLFKEMKNEELDEMFSSYNNEKVQKFIFNSNEKIMQENKLRIIHFIFSAKLIESFVQDNGITGLHRLDSNDNITFSMNILETINKVTSPINLFDVKLNDDDIYDYDFKLDEYLDCAYDFLYSNNMIHSKYHNANDEVLTFELLVLPNLKDYITRRIHGKFNALIFSCVIDELIDKGLIIPTIVHGINKTIIRAYKCGEVYALNSKHFRLFSYALCEYLRGIGKERLHKTEFEKLCVLFFREAIQCGILKYVQATGDEDEYSICYSKFGPRVSTSKPIYNANETSTLASKLLNLNLIYEDEVIVEAKKLKNDEGDERKNQDSVKTQEANDRLQIDKFKTKSHYTINQMCSNISMLNREQKCENACEKEIENQLWVDSAKDFSKKYKLIHKNLFEGNYGERLFDGVRDMHMRTYIEFLTMLAIGLNRREQLLSLLAEIYLYCSTLITNDLKQTLVNYGRILDGLVSGMWKYMCYTQETHPLRKVYEKLNADDDNEFLSISIGGIFRSNPDTDKNEHIEPLIDKAGKLIFSIVYSIWFMYKRYNIAYRVRGEFLDLQERNKREFFYNKLEVFRKSIEDQVKSNSDWQNIQMLQNFKMEAQNLIERYNVEISEGKKHNKEEKKSAVEINVNVTEAKKIDIIEGRYENEG